MAVVLVQHTRGLSLWDSHENLSEEQLYDHMRKLTGTISSFRILMLVSVNPVTLTFSSTVNESSPRSCIFFSRKYSNCLVSNRIRKTLKSTNNNAGLTPSHRHWPPELHVWDPHPITTEYEYADDVTPTPAARESRPHAVARPGSSLSEISIEMSSLDGYLPKSRADLFSPVPFSDLGAHNTFPPFDPVFISRPPSPIPTKLDLTIKLGTEGVFFEQMCTTLNERSWNGRVKLAIRRQSTMMISS